MHSRSRPTHLPTSPPRPRLPRKALPKHLPPDPSGNTIRGQVATVASTNNIAVSNGRVIALCGVKDLVVVETADAILVCHRDAVQNIKQLLPQLPKELL